MAKYDWLTIKDEYVTAPSEAERPTLEELAEKYGCNPSHLREKAAEDGWRVEAERYLQTVEEKRKEAKSSSLAGELAEWDAQCYKTAQAGLVLLFNRLKAVHQAVQTYEEEIKGRSYSYLEPENAPPQHPVSFDSLDKMTRALERLQKVGKEALGEEDKLNVKIDYGTLSDEQLQRLAAGEDPRHVLVT